MTNIREIMAFSSFVSSLHAIGLQKAGAKRIRTLDTGRCFFSCFLLDSVLPCLDKPVSMGPTPCTM